MRQLLVGCLVFVLSAPLARAQDAGELLQACEKLERTIQINGDQIRVPNDTTVYECWYFMQAIQQSARFVDNDGRGLMGSCPASNIKLTQIIRAFTYYAQQHPEKLNQRAADIAYDALAQLFPCK